MKSITDIVPVEWSNRRVLTTAQLAKFYGCETNNIKKNFNANRDRFKAGKHYFKLEGADLAAFKASLVTDSDQALNLSDQALKFAPVLYLWTERGAARHAKMLSTDKAWEIYEELEENYFNPKPATVTEPTAERKPRKNHDVIKGYAFVYVLLLSNGLVKIGCSSNPRTRIAQLKRIHKLTVKDLYLSLSMPREIARLIEWACQEKFSSRRVKGEIFSVTFEEACAAVDNFASAAILPLALKFNIITAALIVDRKID